MKRLLLFGFATIAAMGQAGAQPDDDEDVDQDELDREVPPGFEGDPEADPEPEPPPDRTRRRDPEPEPEPEPTKAVAPRRPEKFSVAIGAGWTLPSGDLLAPDLTTVRVRLASGLTFEPLLHLSRASSTDDDGTNAVTTTTTDLSAALLLRFPYRVNNRVDLSLVGALGLSQVSTDREMMMPDTGATTIGLSWGFALDYWIKPHWAVSFTAINPFAQLSKTTTDIAGLETSTSSNLIGVIFDPEVYLTFHLYL